VDIFSRRWNQRHLQAIWWNGKEDKSTYLHNGLAGERGAKEFPEGHQEVAAADAAQVKQCVGPCCQQKYAPEAVPATSQDMYHFYLQHPGTASHWHSNTSMGLHDTNTACTFYARAPSSTHEHQQSREPVSHSHEQPVLCRSGHAILNCAKQHATYNCSSVKLSAVHRACQHACVLERQGLLCPPESFTSKSKH